MDFEFVSTTNMLIVKNGKALFIKRSKDSEVFPGWYILPGGKQEVSETIAQTAIRETFEETGIKAVEPKLKVVATHNHFYRNRVYIVFIFQADKFSGKLKESDEGTPMWVSIEDIMKDPKLYPDLKRHIKLIFESKDNHVAFTYHKFNKNLEITEEI